MLSAPSFLPAPAGIDMLSPLNALKKGAVRDAVNVNIDTSGGYASREGFAPSIAVTGGHSLWGRADGELGFYVRDDTMCAVRLEGDTMATADLASGLRGAGPMSFCESAGYVFFSNGVDLGRIHGMAVTSLGVPDPAGVPPVAAGAGGLPPGRYAVAYSLMQGSEESGLSEMAFIDLPAGGGVVVSPTDTECSSIRVYVSQTNGDALYLNAEYPTGLTSFLLGQLNPSKLADNRQLHRMPAGDIVKVYNGRLMTTDGPVLRFSEPYRFGLTSRRHNFIQFGADITMVEPVTDGIYVGAGGLVYFLDGGGPSQFTQRVVSSNAPIMAASANIPIHYLPEKLGEQAGGAAIVWLGQQGYSYGVDGGKVHDVQATVIKLNSYPRGSLAHYMMGGDKRVISVVESGTPSSYGVAIDS